MSYTVEAYFVSELTDKKIDEFIWVQCQVFTKTPMTREDFELKFQKNIYGDSIIVIVYDEDGNPAAARAFWRNDINGHLAYQPSDTAVCKEHRRQGLFVKMTQAALDKAGSSAIIYNYPNGNSYPQYIKFGWKDYEIQYARIFTPYQYRKEDDSVIDSDYLRWWIVPRVNEKYGRVDIFKKSYLVRKLNDRGRYIVFGRIHKDDAELFTKVKPILLVYHSAKRAFYSNKKRVGCNIVALNAREDVKIPGWKTDVL